ncbi:MAG: M16 family metallopeptidase, partial [Opitutaceae bacterium]
MLVPSEPPQLAPRTQHRHEDVEVTRCVMAWPIPGLVHDDSAALDLLATILGHGDSSLLWREVRDRQGLVHTIDASAWNPGSSGLFCVSFTCDPAKREAARRAVEKILAGLARKLVAPSELKKAVRQLVVGEINTRKTMSGQASRLGVAEVVVGDLDHSRGYFERLSSLKAAEVRAVAARHLAPERLTVVSSNPRDTDSLAPVVVRAVGSRPDFSEVRLANGARILLQRDRRLPNVHLRILMEGGPLHETPGRRGSTALLGTLLTKDTRRRSAADVARLVEEVGGAIFPFSGNNSVGFGVEVLPPDIGRALDVLGAALLEPAFRASTFA